MKLVDKLRLLTRQRVPSRAALDGAAGLGENATSNLINTGAEPGLAKAAALARALGVSLDWLADDTQGLPAVPAGETLGFTRLLSAEYREQLDRHMVSHGREVVLAAACRLLCEAEPERVGAALATSSVVKARSRPAAPPVTQAAAGAHRRQAARRGAARGDAPAVPPPGQRRNQSGRRSA